MSSPDSERPDRPPGRRALVEALEVRRNAIRGFAAALAFTLAVFGFFVLYPGTSRPTSLYVTLAFVLVVSLGAFLTFLLLLVRAYRLATRPSPRRCR